MTARLADLHFAPTDHARLNLLHEGIDAAAILLTGNTVIDALRQVCSRAAPASDEDDPRARSRYVLVSAQSREKRGAALGRICDGVLELLERQRT